MKKLMTLFVAIAATLLSANAQYNYGSTYGTSTYGTNTNSTYVSCYTKSNGTYVQGHYRVPVTTPTMTIGQRRETLTSIQAHPVVVPRTIQPEPTTTELAIQSTQVLAEVNTISIVMATRLMSPNVDN